MKTKNSLLRKLIPWIIILAALAALIIFVFVPIYSKTEVPMGEPPVIITGEGEGKPLTMENDDLLFEMDTATTQFTVTDKRTGKVWYSNPEDKDSDPIARSGNKEFLYSTLNVTSTTSGGEKEYNNYAYSVQKQNFVVNTLDDGAIQIDYAIGVIEKVYRIPTAISEERYTQFTDAMSKSEKKKVSTSYTLKKPDKLDPNKAEDKAVIDLCPSVLEQPMYILMADTKESKKADMEGYFEKAGYTDADYEQDMALVAGERDNNGPVFNASVIFRLDGPDMVVEVPYTSLRCENDNPMTYISVLPMFGAAGTDKTGYMLIPEGGGAIINYNNGKTNQSNYYANMYGWDYATERKEAVSETRNAFPVFGMNQEDGAFICMVEGAQSYAGIYADIAGRYNSYNYVYAKYNVLHYDRFNVSAKTEKLLYMYEAQIPEDTLIQRYHFMEPCTYVDMANAYGEYLRKEPEMKAGAVNEDLPVMVEMVGAINKIESKMGFPIDSVVPTTTFDQAGKIMDELLENGVKNMSVRMTGWANGGVRQKVLTSVKVLGQLGGTNGMKTLSAKARENNVPLYFDGITCFAYDSGILDGFTPFSDAARFATREQVKLYSYDIVTYQQADWAPEYYLVKPSYAQKCASNLIKALSDNKAAGVAFRDIGNLLSADYYNKDTVTREQVKRQNVETMKEAMDAGLAICVKAGNDYALPYADMITNMNLRGNQYALLDGSVPFYQIAIHGLKDYTGDTINLAGDYMTSLLECAEYGAGLCFTVMEEDNTVVQDSAYSCYTASGYERWKKDVIPMINRYQTEMAGLNNQTIVGHEAPTQNVRVTEYADGTRVYVNYGTTDARVGSVKVPARDYLVERGSK